MIGTAGAVMFPFVMPSSTMPDASLTVWDSVSIHLTLGLMFWATVIFMPLIVFWHTPDNIVWVLTLFGFIYGVPVGVLATYMTESFSTRVRGAAVGTAYNLGRVGAAVAPAAIGLLASHISIGAGFLVMGITYVITGLIPALFIPDRLYDPNRASSDADASVEPAAPARADIAEPRPLKV